MNEIKPSEALFVRALLPHCKRLGAVWLRKTRILREHFRDHKIKSKRYGNIKLKERFGNVRDKDEDFLTMVTVLRKIYKEVHSPSVMAFIRCWLSLTEDEDVCVFTRGDARGHMRRIDGGKGPDKVWRLDTLVGMLYHGLPLTSADSSLIYHACKHELCVRPQHLRFKLSSLAVVLVLKALSQAGYSIKRNDSIEEMPDEFVDVSGPFTIQKLDVLRHEFVKIGQMENYKLATSPDDYYILEQNPSLKKYYMVQSRRVATPLTEGSATQASNVNKRRLLFRLLEDTRKDKFLSQSQNILNAPNLLSSFKPAFEIPDPSSKTETNKGLVVFGDNFVLGHMLPKLLITKEKTSNGNTSSQPMDGEETELIEIMTAPTAKPKSDWMDSMLSEIPQSPSKSALDKLIRDMIRSGSGSDKDSRDGKTTTECRLWSGIKAEIDDSNSELFELLSNMRACSKSDISLKMTPNIFSPISDTEEPIQAAVAE